MTRWSKQQRDRAKQDGLALVGIAIDTRHVAESNKLSRNGAIDFCGPVTDEEAEEVLAFLVKFLEKHAAKGKRK